MTEKPDNIVLEHLRALRADTAALRQGQTHTNERLTAIEHHMAGFFGTSRLQEELITDLTERLERVERRLGLVDEQGEQ